MEWGSSNTLSGLTWDRGATFRGEWRPRGSLGVCFRLQGGSRRGHSRVPFSCGSLCHQWSQYVCSSLGTSGHIQNQMNFHFLEKTILLVISVYLKYFSIIITEGTSGHRAKNGARDVNPQATWDRLKRNFYNFENISLLFPLVSPNHTVFLTYQKTLTKLMFAECFLCARHYVKYGTSLALAYLISIERKNIKYKK